MRKFDRFIIVSAVIFYLIIQLPVFFQENHVYRNLEPYPDGLLYTTSALNFVRGDGLNLINNNVVIKSWVPLTYSLSLIPVYILIPRIDAFIFTNIMLGMGSLILLYKVIARLSKKYFIRLLATLIYLLNGYVILLPTLPMTENLTLFTFTLFSFFYTHNNRQKQLIGGLLAAILLILIKFSNFLVGLTMIYILIKKQKLIGLKDRKISFSLTFLLIMILFLLTTSNLKNTVLNSLNSNFFSFNNIWPNLIFYFKSLITDGRFLWYSAPLSGFALFFIWIKEIKLRSIEWLTLILLAQLPTALMFYISDARYLVLFIAALPLFLAHHLGKYKKSKYALAIGLLCLVTNVYFQKSIIREVVANNIFGRSVAWQVESIHHFNSILADKDIIITSIPPLLINEYSNRDFYSLPISAHQEFISKDINIWNSDIDLSNLKESYDEIFNTGRKMYISNAYNSHNQLVQADFESFKELYNLRLISEGCQQTCNIYLLEEKE